MLQLWGEWFMATDDSQVQHKGPSASRPVPGHRPLDDDMLAMLVALTSELTVLRARQDSMERILASAGVMAEGAVDAFEPDAAATKARSDERKRLIANVFRAVKARAELEGTTL
jgi:hypothetical protein